MKKTSQAGAVACLDLVGTSDLLERDEQAYGDVLDKFNDIVAHAWNMGANHAVKLFIFSDSVVLYAQKVELLLNFIRQLRFLCISLQNPPIFFRCAVVEGAKDWQLKVGSKAMAGNKKLGKPERVIFGPKTVSAHSIQDALKAIGVSLPASSQISEKHGVINLQFPSNALSDSKTFTDLSWTTDDLEKGIVRQLFPVVRMNRLRKPTRERYYVPVFCSMGRSIPPALVRTLHSQPQQGIAEFLEFIKSGAIEELMKENPLRACIYLSVLAVIYDAFKLDDELPEGLVVDVEKYILNLVWLQKLVETIPIAFFNENHRSRYYNRVTNSVL